MSRLGWQMVIVPRRLTAGNAARAAALPIWLSLAAIAGSCAVRGQIEVRKAISAELKLPIPALRGGQSPVAAPDPLAIPPVGSTLLRVLSPEVLELSLITTKSQEGRVEQWDFVGDDGAEALPDKEAIRVLVSGARASIKAMGFKRRALYAPLGRRDLRIESSLYLELDSPVPEGAPVEVECSGEALWRPPQRFLARADGARYSPAIHVNQAGYVPAFPKKAAVGYYLGSLGELSLSAAAGFRLIDAETGREVFTGKLVPRRDQGFTLGVAPYERVFEADFSDFKGPGRYRLKVPGLGASFPFFIDEGAAALFARTYALGLYHQRCGAEDALPFTRFTHGPCHTAPADVPTRVFTRVEDRLAKFAEGTGRKDPARPAPPMKDIASSLYPFVRAGKIDVSGGHHDAGDYSKYTINSAALIHPLIFAADALGGAGDLDNLGLPESGDGIGDLLQIAKWEVDFLAKMQDADGGFYFLVYPRDRPYEDNVLPDRGDPQVVFPKTTAATAAAVAALAQAASSPRMKRAFPRDAERYLRRAWDGWRFLKRAFAARGRDGSYQRITHYGDVFMHNDEIAWAATEMFLATGDKSIHEELLASFDPSDPKTRRWSFERLFEGYGAAVRSYAFAERTGRRRGEELDPKHLAKCLEELRAAALDQVRYSEGSAYATSFPFASKRHRTAGWYFPVSSAFDIAVEHEIDPRPEYLAAILGNVGYEGGANPSNVVFLTGLGWKRQREIVHQFARNDRRALPPSGVPLGSVQSGPAFIEPYRRELGAVSFPSDGDKDNPFPMYDRWGDTFNVKTEFVAAIQARSLAGLAALMARTKLRDQPYRAIPAQITGVPAEVAQGTSVTARLALGDSGPPVGIGVGVSVGVEMDRALIVWESGGMSPSFGPSLTQPLEQSGDAWIEAEAQWPDGRRAFGVLSFLVTPAGAGSKPAK